MQNITFAAPWLLLGLLLLPFLPGRARRALYALRLGALALLILALAQPALRLRSAPLDLLVDVSDSVGSAAAEAVSTLTYPALAFAGDTALVSSEAQDPLSAQAGNTGQTDIGRALQVGAAHGAGRLLLVSDGAQSQGDALASLPDIPVDVLYVPSRGNVRLVSLLAPTRLAPGATAEVVAVVESDRETTVTLRPRVAGQTLPAITREVGVGQTPLRFNVTASAAQGGVLEVEADLELPFAQPLQDDAARAEINVSQEDPVLVIGDPAMARLLGTQGFDVVRGSPASITEPLRYSAVILRESARAFTPGQLELLRSYVEEGGGLMMTGGPQSFGLGSWYRTATETVLPVSTDVRSNVRMPLVALVIIMDRSQSMSTGNPTKLELAKEGAIGVVDLAYRRDLIGFLSFSDKADWVFRPRAATEQGKREMLQAILNVQAGGGTILLPAYNAALKALKATPATIKHIILLTDGQLSDGTNQAPGITTDLGALAGTARSQGITTSSIAIGQEADVTRLAEIAQAGGGRFYEAFDVTTLPRIFTNEALRATRSLLRNGPLPVRVRGNSLTETGISPPRVRAYIASTLKDGSETIFEGREGEPILAVSRQGLGHSAALTTDLNSFAGDFGQWPGLPGVLGTVTRWLQARPDTYQVTATPEGDRLRVVLDAVAGGEFINGESLTARFGGQETRLEQVGPGRYEAFVDAPVSAASGNTLSVSRRGEVVARTAVNAADSEFDTAGGQVLLQEIANRTGGQIIENVASYRPVIGLQRQDVWMWPALAGLALFVLELGVRRFGRAGV